MKILIDSSIWIGYFRNKENEKVLDFLIDENQIVTNDLILAELVPFLINKNQKKIINLLEKVMKNTLNIDWQEIILMQTLCIKKGISGIGIPDLIIAQNCIDHNCKLFTNDNHFTQLQKIFKIELL